MSPRDPSFAGDSDPGQYARLDGLAAEFAARYRRGERPDLEEYARCHPDLAAAIRDLFPAMVGLERAEAIRGESDGGEPNGTAPALSRVGDFRILRQVGRGGMGVVYEAVQVSLGRHVALKVLPSGPLRDPKALERFRREARAAARLHHTNIVPVFEVGQDGDVLYYTMQFIEGQGLDVVIEELKRLRLGGRADGPAPGAPGRRGEAGRPRGSSGRDLGGPANRIARSLKTGEVASVSPGPATDESGGDPILDPTVPHCAEAPGPPGDDGARPSGSAVMPGGAPISSFETSAGRQTYHRSVAQIGRQAAEALAYAHARNVLHRDIKPSNLLLDTSGVVWITDFGLAKAEEGDLTATGDLLGTLRYMAPERLRGEGDARADIYALGLTLYELLTLRPAFDSSDRLRLMEQIRNQEPARPRAVDPRIARDLETLVLKAIEKDPRARYQAAAEMGEDLRRFLDGEPIRARTVGELERAWKWAMRRKAVAGLMALAVGSLVAGMAFSLRFSLQARHYAALAESRARDADAAAMEAGRVAADARAAGAVATAESGEIDRGVFGLIEALELAPSVTAEDAARRRSLLRDIEARMAAQPVLRHVIGGLDDGARVQFTGAGRTVLTLIAGARVRRVELSTGRPVGDPAGIEFPAPVLDVSPDGSLVVTVAAARGRGAPAWDVRVFDAGTGRQRARLPTLECERIEREPIFDPAGRYLGLKLAIRPEPKWDGKYVRRIWRLDPVAPAGPSGESPDRWDRSEVRMIAIRGGHTVLAYPERIKPEGFCDRLLFWDLDDGRPAGRIAPAHPGGVTRSENEGGAYLDSGFDGTSLVYATDAGLVRWWDLASGRPSRPDWLPHGARSPAALASDGRTLAVRCDDDRVRYYDLATGRECGPAPILRGRRAAICPQGSFLLARRGAELAVWQVPEAPRPAHPSTSAVRGRFHGAMAAPGDGEEYAVGEASDEGSAMGRDTLRELIKTLEGRHHRAGQRLATRDGRPRGAPLYPLASHPCYSPDGRLFAACRSRFRKDEPFRSTVVAAWDRASGRQVLPWTVVPQFIHGLAFSPDSRMLAVGVVAGTWLLDVGSRRPPAYLAQSGPIVRLEFSPDGRRLAAGTRSGWGSQPGVRLWDVADGRPVAPLCPTGELPTFAFAPGAGELLVLDFAGRRIIHLDPETGRPSGPAVALSGDDAGTSATDAPESSPRSLACAFRPDGAVLVESPRSSVAQQYDTRTGWPIGPPMVHGDTIGWLAYSPDGTTLVSACPDGTVRLWDAPTGRPLGPVLVHNLAPLGVFFDPDGARLSVVTIDGAATSHPVPRPTAVEDPTRLRLRFETISGLRGSRGGTVVELSPEAWRAGRERLGRLWPGAVPGADGRAELARWHRDRAEDARRLGEADIFRDHLDRLAELDPGDWLPIARGAASLVEDGRLDEAEAEYARAARLATAGELTDWLWHRGVEDLSSGRLAAALWHLDRVVAARPDEWRAREHRAESLRRLGRPAEAVAEQGRAASMGADPSYIAEVAGDRASAGDWSEAARLSARAVALGAEEDAERAVICLRTGDVDGYRRACAAIVATVAAGPARRDDAIAAGWAIGLAPGAVDDYARPLALVDSALAGISRLNAPPHTIREMRREAMMVRAGVLLRAGRADEALVELDKAAGLGLSDPFAGLLAAIAHARAGRVAEAKDRLDGALAALAAEPGRPASWPEKAGLTLLRAEAERVLKDCGFPADPFAGP